MGRLIWCLLLLCLFSSYWRCCAAAAGWSPVLEERKEEEPAPEVHCSRPRSRLAWHIIDEYLLPFVEKEQYNLSSKCRLSRVNDMFREQEEGKDELRPRQWQCGTCKKIFRTEEDLDRHFDNRHAKTIVGGRNRCLADMCGAIHCDSVAASSKVKWDRRKCNQGAVDRNRHLCEALADTCFPSQESATARRLNDFFLRQFCDAHTCKKGRKLFPRGSGKQHGKAIYMAASLFTIIMLVIFYGGVFAARSGRSNTSALKRLRKSGKAH